VGDHNSDGKTIAQASLEGGVLWGRVLTSTGMSFSYGQVVAGVRGTGIKFAQQASSPTNLAIAIPHSSISGESILAGTTRTSDALSLKCRDVPLSLLLGQERIYPTQDCAQARSVSLQTQALHENIHALYEQDTFVSQNVVDDIMYLNSLIQSGSVSEERKEKAKDELGITIPKNNAIVQNALCNGYKPESKYWSIFEDSATDPVCNDYIAYIDYTKAAGAYRGKWMDSTGT